MRQEEKAQGIRLNLKSLWLEQNRKGINEGIYAALRLNKERIEHELEKWNDT